MKLLNRKVQELLLFSGGWHSGHGGESARFGQPSALLEGRDLSPALRDGDYWRSRHPSTPLRGYAEAGASNEGRKEKSLRPFPFEGRFGFKRLAQPPTAANSAPVTNSCNQYEHEDGCDGVDDDPSSTEGYAEDEEDERREREMDASSMEFAGYTPEEIERVTGIKLADDEDVVTNGCNQHQHTPGCMKFAVLKKNKGSRSSKGTPKQFRIKSNTPLKAARLAKPQAQVDATEHALKTREGGGGVVKGAAWVKGKRLDVKGGSSDTGGASHMTKHYKPVIPHEEKPRRIQFWDGNRKTAQRWHP